MRGPIRSWRGVWGIALAVIACGGGEERLSPVDIGGGGGGGAGGLGSVPAPTGSIIFGVTSEIPVDQYGELRVVVRADGDVVEERTYTQGGARPIAFPLEIVFSDRPEGTRVEVDIRAKRVDTSESFDRLASTTVIGGETLLQRVPLTTYCSWYIEDFDTPDCDAPLTCTFGFCRDSYAPPSGLETYSPSWASYSYCKPETAGEPTVSLGQGRNDYAPIEDFDVLTAEAGSQGGHHFWLTLRMKNLRQWSLVTLSAYVPDLGLAIGPLSYQLSFIEDPASGSCDGTTFFRIDDAVDMSELLGLGMQLRARVEDEDGASAEDSKTVAVAETTVEPRIASEIDLDAPLYDVEARGAQVDPAIAWNGASYLAVWEDQSRAEATDGVSEVRGVLVSPDGSPLSPRGLVIGASQGEPTSPAVAALGTTFLVVWESEGATGARDILAARVSGEGVLLDPTPLEITSAPADQRHPDVCAGDEGFLVVWEDPREGGGNDIYGARVSPDGAVLDPGGIAISTAVADQSHPAAALNGSDFLVVWHDLRNGSRDVYGARVRQDGAALDPDGITISTAQSSQLAPDVAAGEGSALVVWRDHRTGNHDIFGARLGPDGEVLDPIGAPITSDPAKQEQPSVAFGAGSWLVAWRDERDDPSASQADLYGSRVSAAGAVIDPEGAVIASSPANELSAGVEWAGDGWLAVWQSSEYGDELEPAQGIHAVRITNTGGVLDPDGVVLSWSERPEGARASAWNGASYLVVWEEQEASGSWAIRGALMSPAGEILEPASILLAVGDIVHDVYPSAFPNVVVASNGAAFFVAWREYDVPTDSYRIIAKRVSADGSVLDPDPIVIDPNTTFFTPIAVAWGHDVYLVAWSDVVYVNSARVSAAGTVLDAPSISIYEHSVPDGVAEVALASQGAEFFVVWSAEQAGEIDLRGARVSAEGVVLDPDGVPLAPGEGIDASPTVAFDGSSYRLVWEKSENMGPPRLVGTRVDTTGIVLDPIEPLIPAAPGVITTTPRLICDGFACLTLWESTTSSGESTLHGAWIDPAAATTPADPFVIATASSADLAPSGASGGFNQFLVTYTRFDPVAGVPQAKARLVSRPLVGACLGDLDCLTGHCVNGQCCFFGCGAAEHDFKAVHREGGGFDCRAAGGRAGPAPLGWLGALALVGIPWARRRAQRAGRARLPISERGRAGTSPAPRPSARASRPR